MDFWKFFGQTLDLGRTKPGHWGQSLDKFETGTKFWQNVDMFRTKLDKIWTWTKFGHNLVDLHCQWAPPSQQSLHELLLNLVNYFSTFTFFILRFLLPFPWPRFQSVRCFPVWLAIISSSLSPLSFRFDRVHLIRIKGSAMRWTAPSHGQETEKMSWTKILNQFFLSLCYVWRGWKMEASLRRQRE